MEVKKIAVLGAGQMGSGIAQVAAYSGYEVNLMDVSEELLEKGMKGIRKSLDRFVKSEKLSEEDAENLIKSIFTTTEMAEAVTRAQLVIEAVPEDLALKKEIFGELESICEEGTILASNTTELSITDIASVTGSPDKVIGMHWFNPAPVMKLIEIVAGIDTSDETIEAVKDTAHKMGKETVLVKDAQGFVTSRILAAHMMECMRVLEEGVASAEDIDKAVRLGLNYPMGPFELADYVGLDTLVYASEGLTEAFGDRFRAPQVLRKLVEAGHLGRKTGRGFYDYG
ncbi:MAG: 3-hydroxyacyl-CoA dehydrogenase family protein [Bacillota bacterium]